MKSPAQNVESKAQKVSSNVRQTSELNPPGNITPSTATTLRGLLVILPLALFLFGLFTRAINP